MPLSKERIYETEKHVIRFGQLPEDQGKDFIVHLEGKAPNLAVIEIYRGNWSQATNVWSNLTNIVEFVSAEKDIKANAERNPAPPQDPRLIRGGR